MTNRERLLSILNHQLTDCIPWIPRLQLWYQSRINTQSLPDKWKSFSLREIEQDLGVGTPARAGKIFKQYFDGIDIVSYREGNKSVVEYHTPVGNVFSTTIFSEILNDNDLPGRIQEFPLKQQKDYKVWEYIVKHTYWIETYNDYLEYDKEIGEDGLPLVLAGDVPFHEFCLNLAGYNYAYYHLMDFPNEVEKLLSTMYEVQKERLWPIIIESPALLLLHGYHLSSQLTPPPLFKKYITPYYEEFMSLMHNNSKHIAMHADNDVSQLLQLIEDTGWDMVECLVTTPMVPLSLKRAREQWGNRIIIWGGIPSILLSPSVSEQEFRDYIQNLFKNIAPGDAFILGVSDNVMPDSLIERVAWISQYVARHGRYPLR